MSLTTGNNSIDSLVYSSWNSRAGQPARLTYSFMTSLPAGSTADDANGFAPMSAVQQDGVRKALATWAAVANITFVEVGAGGNIQIGTNNQGTQSSGYAYLPNGGDPTALFTNNQDSYNSSFTDGDYGNAVLIHELGHTLGLKHPGNYNSTGSSVDGPFLPAATDNLDYTQMSYNVGAGFKLEHKYGISPMLYDIQAMQYLYGANMAYHTGADTYSFSKDAPLQCIWDAGGNDVLDFSACTDATIINLNAGTFSSTAPGYNNVSIAYNVTIENAIAGSGGSTIYANAAGNVITGGSGNDLIYEGAGNDVITGGGGNDTVVFNYALDSYLLSGSISALTVRGDGEDILNGITSLRFSDRTIQLANFSSVQSGTSGNDALVAKPGNELITGGGGTDTLSFATARGNFTVKANGTDFTVTDNFGGGTDLLSGVERLLFLDGTGVALDVGGFAGQTYRLYQAAFNRQPDVGGVGFWLNQLDHGLTLVKMAQFFLDSPESLKNYGALDNTAFVSLMYNNVLHRAPDAAGLKFYLDGFDAGSFTRAQVLQGFSESPENQAAVIGSITNGVDYTIVA